VLLEQVYVIDGESRVKAAVAAAAKEVGAPIAVTGFHRMVLGEGIQREQKDFAAEVAAQLGS
jgi:Translation elongation factor Ts